MNSNSRCTSQAPEGEEQGNDHDAKIITHPEDTHVSPRSSRSRTLRSPRRTESRQLQWSNHRDAEAQAGPSEKPIRLREAVRGSLSSRTRSPAKRWWARARGKGRKKIGWMESFRAIVLASWLNIFLILIPFSWAAHFLQIHRPEAFGGHAVTFALAFIAIIPLEKLFDWGGEQLAMYCGEDIGDLIIISLNNAVEATLAFILLAQCKLKLLQSTIAGVVLLHLLLIPGTTFFIGGARIIEQELQNQRTQLNQSLLTFGILSLIVPAAFFSALDSDGATQSSSTEDIITDSHRDAFLAMSRGFALLLLLIYILSRWYLHDPPGKGNALQLPVDAPAEMKKRAKELEEAEPEVSPTACVVLLAVSVALMAVTAELLVHSIESVLESSNITQEFFGLIILPIVSFAANGVVAVVYFIHSMLIVPAVYVLRHTAFRRHVNHSREFKLAMKPPTSVAEARSIDLSIQFMLFWMPFLVLLGWWTQKPMSLLFDLFEVTVLIGSTFLVNYITADAKTNWAEGAVMIAFYFMIALAAWYYTGQPEVEVMTVCTESVAAALGTGEVPTGQ